MQRYTLMQQLFSPILFHSDKNGIDDWTFKRIFCTFPPMHRSMQNRLHYRRTTVSATCQWSLSTVCYILSVGVVVFRLAHSIWMLFPKKKCHAPSGFLNISHIHNLRQTHASVSLRQPNERLQLTWVGRHLPPRASHLPHLHVGLDQGLASLLTQRWVNKGFCIGQVVLQDAHILENNSGGRGWTPS